MKYPIIITAPHACSKIKDPAILDRLALDNYEIFKFSDPFTNELGEFACASYKHISDTHRLICDFNRAPGLEAAFHAKDFFGREVFKEGREFTSDEKRINLEKHWWPFHNKVLDSIYKLDEEGHEVILVVDYHNTSGDHPLSRGRDYMPSVIISNLGHGYDTGKAPIVCLPNKHLEFLAQYIGDNLQIGVEMNTIYQGGYNMIWIKQLQKELDINARLYAVQIEYNLDYVFNPISKKTDRHALHILQKVFNDALVELYERLWAEENKTTIEMLPIKFEKDIK